MKKVVIVVGLTPKSLCVCRLMGRSGWFVYTIFSTKENYQEFGFSKYINKRIMVEDDIEIVIKKIKQIKCENAKSRVKIIITSAIWLAKMRENHPELWHHFDVSSGPIEALNIVADKHKLYGYCRQIGLNTVKDVLYADYQKGCITYPIVVKHNVESVIIKEKCVKINSENELINYISQIPPEVRQFLVLQEFFGDDFTEMDYRGYVEDGHVIGFSVVESLRSKPIGMSTYLEEVTDAKIIEEVSSMANKLLTSLHYSGFVGMDLKYRKSDNTCYILDFNPRVPGSFSEWVVKYNRKDLQKTFSGDSPNITLQPKKTGVRWVNLDRDFLARKEKGEWKGLMKSLTARYDVWDLYDPLPFLLMWPCKLYRSIKRWFG